MEKIGFEFPIDGSGQWDGFNDPGMEHFTGNRLQHLGREVPQNTIDAKVSSPARIEIAVKKVPLTSLPSIEELKATMSLCASAAVGEDSEKAVKFFEAAGKLLSAKDLFVLQLRDSNTTGLSGPCENGKPYFAMMKATGQSKKVGTSTGSYGIGKFAPFTVSELRTVFVSTVWTDQNSQTHHYVQGKSVLMSHIDGAGNTRRGTGFWGVKEQCQPVTTLNEIPDWLQLVDENGDFSQQHGTMLSIIGFAPSKGWQHILAANIIENFFGAISRNELEVIIDGGVEINSKTLSDVLTDAEVKASVSQEVGEPEKFDNVASYLRALRGDSEVQVEKSEQLHLGECVLHILVGENLPRKVAVLRNGMLITEALPGLIRFGDFKEFVAVLECTSEKGLELLRAMEPPRHDAFEPDRLPPDRRANGRTAIKDLATWVRKMLVRHAKDQVSEETSLDEMAAFFGDEDEDGVAKQKDENPGGAIIIRARPIKVKSVGKPVGGSTSSVDEEEGSGNGGTGDSGDGNGEGDGQGGGQNASTGGNQAGQQGGGGQQAKTQSVGLPLRDVRAVPISSRNRRVAFTPMESGQFTVELQDSGADTNYSLLVVSSDQGTVNNGRIEGLQVTAGVRCVIEVELSDDFTGTLRVVANAI